MLLRKIDSRGSVLHSAVYEKSIPQKKWLRSERNAEMPTAMALGTTSGSASKTVRLVS
jgi:hypothetical protein